MSTTVVNLQREPFDVYIGRAGQGQDGYFGNPFKLGAPTMRDHVLDQYRDYFNQRVVTDATFAQRILHLRGKRLGCFCKPLACHGDVIVEWLNSARCDCGAPASYVINPHEMDSRESSRHVYLCHEHAA